MFGNPLGCSIPLPRKAPNSLFTAFPPSVKVFPSARQSLIFSNRMQPKVFHRLLVLFEIFFDIFLENRYDGGEIPRKVM
jgi:hypothetical protein